MICVLNNNNEIKNISITYDKEIIIKVDNQKYVLEKDITEYLSNTPFSCKSIL